jgi:broad specificity phosphatase PhoE
VQDSFFILILCYYSSHMPQSTATTYYIFRHGETFATKRWNGFYGWRVFTAPILEEEKPMLYRLAEFLKDQHTDYNASSQILRCRQTSGIVSEVTGKEFVYDRRLREFFFESFGQLRRRVRSFISDIEANGYASVAICTHGAVIAELAKELLAQSAEVPLKRVFPKPGELYIIREGKLEKKSFR